MAHPRGAPDTVRKERPRVIPPWRPEHVGGLPLPNAVLLAPLAGVTIPPLRLLFSRLGAGAVHTEMVSCAGLVRENRKTKGMLAVLPGEAPVILQLFAGDSDTLLSGGELALKEAPFSGLGINMACPMPKVLKKGAGARLLEKPGTAFLMVRRLKETGLPVWPKIRKCSPGHPLATEDFCEGLLDAGADLVCIHGRTPQQRYSGESDRASILAAAKRFPGKICASGDVFSPESAAAYIRGGCAAVVAARGILGNAFLVPEILSLLGYPVDERFLAPSGEVRKGLLVSFGDSVKEMYGSRTAVFFARRLLSGFFRGVHGIGRLRREAAAASSWEALRSIVEGWEECLPAPGEFVQPAECSENLKI